MNAVRPLRSRLRSPRLARLAQTTVAWLALLVLLAGAAELHGASADHWSNRGAGTGSRVAAANHPFDAHHFEAATLKDHPPCPACLLQAQSVAVGLAAPAVLPALTRQEAPAGPASPARRAMPTRSGSPRAPPRSSVR